MPKKPALSFQYNAVAKFLHWLIALAIVAMLVIGWTMTNLPKGNSHQFALFQMHKSIGITILLLSLLRLAWRLTHKTPPLPAAMPVWEKWAAKVTHFIFYVLMIGMPLSGWVLVSTSAFNLPTYLYGVVPWPPFPGLQDLSNKQDIHHFAGSTHVLAAYILAGLLVLHVGAAWKHHLFNRDNVLLNMTPGFMQGILKRLQKWG